MYFVYIIQSVKTNRYYIGYTNNIENRLAHHNSGASTYTRKYRPWVLVYSEKFPDKISAWKRERQIKLFKGGNAFKKLLEI